MKDIKDIQMAVDEIKEICKKHNILLVGTCCREGVYGEITIMDSSGLESFDWNEVEDQIGETVLQDCDGFTIAGIGEIK